MNSFNSLAEFKKEFKRLFKKYKTLNEDFEKFKKVILAAPTGVGKNFVIIHDSPSVKIIKARMACRALRIRSLRIIYAYKGKESTIDFIELYFKGERANENRTLINNYLRRLNC
mgnify:FL=1